MTITVSDLTGPRVAPFAKAPVVARIAEVRAAVADARAAGRRIAFVPTMGALHEGHLRLLDVACDTADFVVVSIFVNPLQFGAGEDLTRYPRDVAGDIEKSRSRGANLVFVPVVEEMYPGDARTSVSPLGLDDRWEGAVRPGHFRGVLTVVAKLFNIVRPDIAVFGQKDAQQVAVVRALIRDLDFPIELVVAPTVREADGLAMSSRNAYLSDSDRARAVALSRAVRSVQSAFAAGTRDATELSRLGRVQLEMHSIQPDYVAVVDPASLEPVAEASRGCLVLVAAPVGGTRLIDNAILGDA